MQAETPGALQRAEPAQDDKPKLPIDLHSAALAWLALLASVYMLRWASVVIIPVLLGLMCSHALSPLVDRLQRWRVPRACGAAALLLALVGGVGAMGYSLGDDATAMIESLPEAAQKARRALRATRAPEGPIAKVQRAAAKLEQAAEEGATLALGPGKEAARAPPQPPPPKPNVRAYLWTGTLGLVGLIGQALVVLFITFYLVVSGDSFRRKIVKIAGPRLSRKKITVQVLDDIGSQIQRYMLVQVGTSVLVGLATWGMLLCFGLERAAVWGVAAGLLNLVPYVGSIVTAGALTLAAFLQFGTLGIALSVGAGSLVINTLEGNLLTPWLTGRAARMNPLVIFVGVLAFGWLWGLWGLLLGAPLLMATKAVCDRVEGLQPVGELLGR